MPIAPRLTILPAAVPGRAGGETHAQRIRTLYAAVQAGDVGAVLDRLAPGVEWEEDRAEPGFSIRRRHLGRRAVARLLADPGAFPRALDFVHLVESGDEVAALVAEGAALVAKGVAPLRLEAHLWMLDPGGLVTRFRQVSGPARMPTRH